MANPGPMRYIAVDELEANFGPGKSEHLARESEQVFLNQLVEIAYDAAWDQEVRAIFISGPTSSGKTTFGQRLGSAVHLFGRKTVHISLDDYYHNMEYVYDEWGRPNLETIEALDLELIRVQMEALLRGEEVVVPHYDFAKRESSFIEERRTYIDDNTLMVVEGLHGLSSEIIGKLPHKSVMGVFVCPWATLVDDETLLEPEQIRQIRRLARDHHHRGTSPIATLDYWPVIDLSEKLLFNDYLTRADYFVNTVIPYEFFVLGPMAANYLKADLERIERGEEVASSLTRGGTLAVPHKAVEDAKYLIKICEQFPVLPKSFVPPMSILNEFIN